MISKNFDELVLQIDVAMKTIYPEAKKQLSDNPDSLLEQLRAIDSYHTRLQFILSEADYYYNKAKLERLPPKEEGMTQIDRECSLSANTAKEKQMRNLVEDMCRALRDKISLGQSMLKYFTELKQAGIQ